MNVVIVSPEKTLFSDSACSVVVPGTNGAFEILENHAPIISSLQRGVVSVAGKDGKVEIPIESGFVEVAHNEVSVCVES